MKLEDVIKGTEVCLSGGIPQRCVDCPYHRGSCDQGRMIDSLREMKDYKELRDSLLELGYPHNFQKEEPWIRDYCYKITGVIKMAYDAVEEEKK